MFGLTVLQEVYRSERQSYKLDLAINGNYCLELFSFPNPPQRPSRPEAAGLRHLAFEVDDIVATQQYLSERKIETEAIRIDEYTGKRFFFIADPDDLPIEFYEK